MASAPEDSVLSSGRGTNTCQTSRIANCACAFRAGFSFTTQTLLWRFLCPKTRIIPTCVTSPLPTAAAASFLIPLTTWPSAVSRSKAPPAHHCTRGRSPDQSVSRHRYPHRLRPQLRLRRSLSRHRSGLHQAQDHRHSRLSCIPSRRTIPPRRIPRPPAPTSRHKLKIV
jgi:hypothetical protein